jgi:hypothetical protein
MFGKEELVALEAQRKMVVQRCITLGNVIHNHEKDSRVMPEVTPYSYLLFHPIPCSIFYGSNAIPITIF